MTNSSVPERSPLDPRAVADLKEMTGNDPVFFGELIDTYLQDSPDLLATIRAALSADDLKTVRRAAHSLKSNSLSFGANTLGQLCRKLEAAAQTGDGHEANSLLPRVEAEYVKVEAAIRSLRQEG